MTVPLNRITCRLVFIACLLLVALPAPAVAVQWQKLAQTKRHYVALDIDSINLTTLGRLTVWLRFTPLGEYQRKLASSEFGKKDYRRHLEFYEVDCSDNSAVLGLTDIIGPAGKRLERLQGGVQPDAIIPGSVLEKAAQKVCPVLEDENVEADEVPDATEPADYSDSQTSRETEQRITVAIQRTEKEPANFEAWTELGNAYYDADMPRQAIDAYNRSLALKPDNADVLNDQGAMYRQSENFTQALTNFEKAFTIDPNNLESLYNMGYVNAFDLNRMELALDIWRRYLEHDHSSETASQVQSFIDRYSKQ
ncbi:MAG: tetratricopeptide repeat protein [Pedobacter sp.]